MADYIFPYESDKIEQYLAKSKTLSGEPLGTGVYADGLSFASYSQYLNDGGVLYQLKSSIATPYTTNTTAYPSANLDPNLFEIKQELKSIALSLNVPVSAVIYSTDTTTILDNVQYIYDNSNETIWSKPSGVQAGDVIISVVSDQLTVTSGTYTMRRVETENDRRTINSRDLNYYKLPSESTYDNALERMFNFGSFVTKSIRKEDDETLVMNFGAGSFNLDGSYHINLNSKRNVKITGNGRYDCVFDITNAPDGYSLITQDDTILQAITMHGFTCRSEATEEKHLFKIAQVNRGGSIYDVHTYNLIGKPSGFMATEPLGAMHFGSRIQSEFTFSHWSASLDFNYVRNVGASLNYCACTFYGNAGTIEHWNVVSQFKYAVYAKGVEISPGIDTGEGVKVRDFNAAGWNVTTPSQTMHRAVYLENVEQGSIEDGYVEGLEDHTLASCMAFEIVDCADVNVKKHTLNSGGILFTGQADEDFPTVSRANSVSSVRYGDTLRGVYFKGFPRVEIDMSGLGRQTEDITNATAKINPEFQTINGFRESSISQRDDVYLDNNPFIQNIGPVTSPSADTSTLVSGTRSWKFTATGSGGGQRFSGSIPGADGNGVYTLTMYVMVSGGGDAEIVYRSGDANVASYEKLMNHRPNTNVSSKWQTLRYLMEFNGGDTYDFVIQSNIANTQVWVDAIFIENGYTQKSVKVS